MSYIKVTETMKAKKEEKPKRDKPARKNTAEPSADENFSSELNEPRWSVVSFEMQLTGNLTYEQAAREMKEFKAKKVSGLCIITDEAAERIK